MKFNRRWILLAIPVAACVAIWVDHANLPEQTCVSLFPNVLGQSVAQLPEPDGYFVKTPNDEPETKWFVYMDRSYSTHELVSSTGNILVIAHGGVVVDVRYMPRSVMCRPPDTR